MRSLRRPAVRLAIAPASKVFVAGEPITVRVTAVGRRDVSIRAASAGMIARIWYRHSSSTGAAHVFVAPPAQNVPPPAIVTGADTSLSFPATMPAGGTVSREVALPNWARAPAHALGVLKIEYWLRAQLTLGDGRTIHRGVKVGMQSRRSLNQAVEGAPLAYRHHQVESWPVHYRGDWDMAAHLTAQHAMPGQLLRGVLRVSPHQPAQARRILVSVQMIQARARPPMPAVMTEADYGSDVESPVATAGRLTMVTLATRTRLSEPRDFPFTIQLPRSACPTIVTRYLTVRLYLRAWVQDESSRWQVSDSEINVYTAPD